MPSFAAHPSLQRHLQPRTSVATSLFRGWFQSQLSGASSNSGIYEAKIVLNVQEFCQQQTCFPESRQIVISVFF